MITLEEIKNKIKSCNICVKDIAAATGVHENTIRAIVRGDDINPRYNTYESLAAFCSKTYSFTDEARYSKLQKSLTEKQLKQIESLESLECNKVKNIGSSSMVYALVKSGSVIYIGQSSNGLQRPMTHNKDKDFDSIYWIEVEQSELDKVESFLILKMQPKLNGKKRNGNMNIPITNGFFVESER